MVTNAISGSMLATSSQRPLRSSPPASSLLPSGRWRPASKTKGWSMGSDRICYHTVAMSTASLLLVAGCCRIRIQLTNTKHNAFLLLCLSHAARCSIAANFDDAGTGLLARFFMCIVVRCSFLLLGGTAIFADTAVSHRSSAFFYSHKKLFVLAHHHCIAASLFTHQWEL